MRMIPFYSFTSKEKIDTLGQYLQTRFSSYFKDSKDIAGAYTSNFRKAVCLYDSLKYKRTIKVKKVPDSPKTKDDISAE